jgi:hypothetical protein
MPSNARAFLNPDLWRTKMKKLIVKLLSVILVLQPIGGAAARAANTNKDEDRLKTCGSVL